ncbi:MAG: ATP-binding protein [Nanoarchaeota archaeon]|nr:ATP-binding protein [Nanoarchaeota archaeon]
MRNKFSIYLSLTIKLILIISIFTSINNHLWHIASTNIFLLILTFIPQFLKSQIKIKFPKEFELLLLIFIIFTLTLGKLKGIIAPMVFGMGTGLIALLILFLLYNSNQIKKNYFLIISYAFGLSMTFAISLELTKYYLKLLLKQTLDQGIYLFTMNNLTYVLIGTTISCIIGLIYMKTHFKLLHKILKKIKYLNPDKFKKINSTKEIVEEIKKGESESQEFKSTLRTNLHTNEKDKKIEHGILKTISAFLNTKGGVLFIGVTDDGKILGIEKDNFENIDKFELHLTNLIKLKLSKKELNNIKIEIIQLKDRHIARLEMNPSKKAIFVRDADQ